MFGFGAGFGTKESSPPRTSAQQKIYDDLAHQHKYACAQLAELEAMVQARKEQIAALGHALNALRQAK